MPIQRTESVESARSFESICTILSCDSDRFTEFYYGPYVTDVLCEDALKAVEEHRKDLRSANKNYNLVKLLLGMIEHAQDPLGKRYVSTAIHIAATKGKDAMIEVAQAWLDYLFLPMLTKSRALLKVQPSGSQTPTIEATAGLIEGATRSDQASLRNKVARREGHRCAITKILDDARVEALLNAGRGAEIPEGSLTFPMNAAHIIPFSLNDFDDKISKEVREAAHTWDMLQSWTQIDIKLLVGEKINSPANAIYMSIGEHAKFGRFHFYLDKQGYPDTPNKYKAQMTRPFAIFSNGNQDADVEFSATEEGVEPPNPEFLRVHAAFARVLNLCGAAEYIDRIERDAERNDLLSTSEGWDTFTSFLMLRTGVTVH